jgi:hypothetical protein
VILRQKNSQTESFSEFSVIKSIDDEGVRMIMVTNAVLVTDFALIETFSSIKFGHISGIILELGKEQEN